MSSKRTRKSSPSYRLHKASGNAIVELNGKRVYLGKYDTPESREQYFRTLAEWESNGRTLPEKSDEVTVVEILARYLEHAELSYQDKDGNPTSEMGIIRRVSRLLRKLYGRIPAAQFSPRNLKTLQNEWVKTGIARTTVNRYTSIVKRVFKWAASECLVEPNIFLALQAVEGLRKGRTEAPESEPVGIVADENIQAVKPYVSAEVWAMIELQLACAARSGEIVTLRMCDIDRTRTTWKARLSDHKTAHHGQDRTLYFNPEARRVLTPFFFGKAPDDYLFSPAAAVKARHRKTARGTRRENQPESLRQSTRTLGKHYTTGSYRRAIVRACEKAGVPVWTPHQLRHTAATRFRAEHGLELTQKLLGHAHARVTEVYAEVDEARLLPAVERDVSLFDGTH